MPLLALMYLYMTAGAPLVVAVTEKKLLEFGRIWSHRVQRQGAAGDQEAEAERGSASPPFYPYQCTNPCKHWGLWDHTRTATRTIFADLYQGRAAARAGNGKVTRIWSHLVAWGPPELAGPCWDQSGPWLNSSFEMLGFLISQKRKRNWQSENIF